MSSDKQPGRKESNFYKYLKTIKLLSRTLLLIFILILSTTTLHAETPVAPVYRFWSDIFLHHFYTISEEEKDYVMATWPDVWKYEKVGFYAYPMQVEGTLPVYRFWSDEFLGHFYTISEEEKDYVMATWPDVWSYEKIGFYAYPTNPLEIWNLLYEYKSPFINGLTYGNGIFVAVGNPGPGDSIFTSSDGVSWVGRNSGMPYYLNGIHYFNSLYVAVGDLGSIITSPDGINWTSRNSDTSYNLNGVVYGNGKYVAVGGDVNESKSIILTSADGVQWIVRNSYFSSRLSSVTYGNGIFIAVGESGTLLTSVDGVIWDGKDSGTMAPLSHIMFSNGIYIAVGGNGVILTSNDGINWVLRDSGTSAGLNGVAYGNGLFVVTGYNAIILTSQDGINWTKNPDFSSLSIRAVVYANGTFVAFGFTGWRHGSSSYFLTSSDGIKWSVKYIGQEYLYNHPGYFYSITYNNNGLIVAGDSILHSFDGNSWANSGLDSYYGNINAVTSGNGILTAVGWGGTILTSSDGVAWFKKNSGISNVLYGVAYGNGLFVAVGENGTIVTSPDTETWSVGNSNSSATLYGIIFVDNQFIAVGVGGILTSPDGSTWTVKYSGAQSFRGITYANKLFVAVGFNSIILTSTDGSNWKIVDSGVPASAKQDYVFYGVTYGKGVYVICGVDIYFGDRGIILSSNDGKEWYRGNSGGGYAITFANDSFYTAWGRQIFKSDPL
jgi:hypothetical protein